MKYLPYLDAAAGFCGRHLEQISPLRLFGVSNKPWKLPRLGELIAYTPPNTQLQTLPRGNLIGWWNRCPSAIRCRAHASGARHV